MNRLILILSIFPHCISVNAQQGTWTWMSGDTARNINGIFGTQGIPSLTNHPPALYESVRWADLNGNFWLFGGTGRLGSSSNYVRYSDLWKFDPNTLEWTWMKGPGTYNQAGIYGAQGVPSLSNNPGARGYAAASWTDSIGDLWMYGGDGHNISGGFGTLGDLWRYNIATNEWTWMNGSAGGNDPMVFGTQNVSAASNSPGTHSESTAAWTGNNNTLWFYGGQGHAPMSTQAYYKNEVWSYDISTNMWTWRSGAGVQTLQSPNYGAFRIPSTTNDPGGRMVYTHWKDSSGNFWMLCGEYWDSPNNVVNQYNDVWMYDPNTEMWSWQGGNMIPDQLSPLSPYCVLSSSNAVPPRYENPACWNGPCGSIYFFGGYRTDTAGTFALGDLWCYVPASNEWAIVSGDTTRNHPGNAGILGVPSASNRPRARFGAVSWTDTTGKFWMFGGMVYDSQGLSIADDMWNYVPVNCPDLSNCSGIATDIDESNANVPKNFLLTPYGDGNTNVFLLPLKDVSDYRIVVINTLGQTVFSSRNSSEAWKGSLNNNGAPLAAGTYLYLVNYTNAEGKKVVSGGKIMLLK